MVVANARHTKNIVVGDGQHRCTVAHQIWGHAVAQLLCLSAVTFEQFERAHFKAIIKPLVFKRLSDSREVTNVQLCGCMGGGG